MAAAVVSAAAVVVPLAVQATTIVPPRNLGELARRADAVVLARAGSSQVVRRRPLLFTATRFELLETLSARAPLPDSILVEAPGGELDGVGWAVAGSPRFEAGEVYLLLLHDKGNGVHVPSMHSFGVLQRVAGKWGRSLLVPIGEHRRVEVMARPDGVVPELPAAYREAELLAHLRSVVAGAVGWSARSALAVPQEVPDEPSAPPAGCTNISSPPVRWPYNTASPPGNVKMYAETTGDLSRPGGGFTEVQGAVNAWDSTPSSSLDLSYGGKLAYTMTCSPNPNDVPNANVVIFNDPCNDIEDLSGCAGVLGFGGPFWGGPPHSFDGTSWNTIVGWVVVLNNGITPTCMSTSDYEIMITHELGHGLGYGHYPPGNLMYGTCCNPMSDFDRMCTQYVYPGAGPTVTPTTTPTSGPTPTTPPTRTPTRTRTPTPTEPTPIPQTPTPTPTATRTRTATPAVSPTPTRTPTITPTRTATVPPPIAAFSFAPESPITGQAVQFTDGSSGASSWAWTFGDGGTSSLRSPTHAYAVAGTYAVELAATNAGGTARATRPVTVRAAEQPRIVPVVAHLAGVGGTAWRSDVALANPSDGSLALQLLLKPSGSGSTLTRDLTLAPRESRLLPDLVATLFAAGDVRGGLRVVPPQAGPVPAVLGRTYAVEAGGNLGQGVPAVLPEPSGLYYVPGLYSDSAYRTNVGVTAGGQGVFVTFRLFRGVAGEVGTLTTGIMAHDQQQWSIDGLFPGRAQPGVPMTIGFGLPAPGVPYASLVDQVSRDSVFLIGAAPADEWLVPVVAHNPGQQGTFWRTDVGVFNPGGSPATVDLEYLPQGLDNSGGGMAADPVSLPAYATVVVEDVAGTLFGVANGKGALLLRGSAPLVVASRTYTNRPGGGTFGHGGPPVRPQVLSAAPRTVAGVRQTGGYRSNVGLVTGSRGVIVTLRLRDADGTVLATRSSLYVPPRSLVQLGLANLFPGAPAPDPVGSLEVLPDGPLLAYLSVVDGTSQDPVLVLAP